jgi:molybdopterin adenylyltransferase
MLNPIRIGLVAASDRASLGIYQDKGIPAMREWLEAAILNPCIFEERLVPDEQAQIEATLCELIDEIGCDLLLTTGGTGPALRDVTPDATLAVANRLMPGFGEQMRQISLNFVPTAILSRQVGAIRGRCLILNLPGQPKSIRETLEGVRDDDGKLQIKGIFASVPYCIQLLEGPYIETRPEIIPSFRPKSAIRAVDNSRVLLNTDAKG